MLGKIPANVALYHFFRMRFFQMFKNDDRHGQKRLFERIHIGRILKSHEPRVLSKDRTRWRMFRIRKNPSSLAHEVKVGIPSASHQNIVNESSSTFVHRFIMAPLLKTGKEWRTPMKYRRSKDQYNADGKHCFRPFTPFFHEPKKYGIHSYC